MYNTSPGSNTFKKKNAKLTQQCYTRNYTSYKNLTLISYMNRDAYITEYKVMNAVSLILVTERNRPLVTVYPFPSNNSRTRNSITLMLFMISPKIIIVS